jgi:hypothetical protein
VLHSAPPWPQPARSSPSQPASQPTADCVIPGEGHASAPTAIVPGGHRDPLTTLLRRRTPDHPSLAGNRGVPVHPPPPRSLRGGPGADPWPPARPGRAGPGRWRRTAVDQPHGGWGQQIGPVVGAGDALGLAELRRSVTQVAVAPGGGPGLRSSSIQQPSLALDQLPRSHEAGNDVLDPTVARDDCGVRRAKKVVLPRRTLPSETRPTGKVTPPSLANSAADERRSPKSTPITCRSCKEESSASR